MACGTTPIISKGAVNINFKTSNNKCYDIKFYLVPNLNEKILIGEPFLREHKATIDYSRRCTYLGTTERETIYWIPELSRVPEISSPKVELEVPPEYEKDLRPLLDEFADIFTPPSIHTATLTTKHKIVLTDNKIINNKPYPLSPQKTKILYDQIEEMLSNGIIEPTNSEYSSSPVIIERPNKKPRFCVDYRGINSITKNESSVLPKIPDVLKSLGSASVFSVLDLKSGYWQIPMSQESKKYTAFSTPDGASYHFNVLPFGLKNAPSCFQNVMTREVLAGHLHNFTQVYLDDILIYSKNITEHREHLRLVFERLRQHNLKVSPEKCTIATDNIEYLGHNIHGSITTPLNKHLESIRNFPTPKTKRQVQSFLGIFNWIREYLPDAANLTRPLTELLKNNRAFKWNDACQEAFESLKEQAARPLSLHRPDFEKKFYLQVDASQKGLGAVLFQKDDDGNRLIISYSSATLKEHEKKFHINELEVYGAIYGIKKYRAYLADKPFVLITDSKSLYWLEKNRDAKAKLTRWSILLQEYNFEVEHCTGKDNQLADFLSRNATEERLDELVDEERLLPPENPTPIEINALRTDQLYHEIVKAQSRSQKVKNDILMWHDIDRHGPQNRRERHFHQKFVVENNNLYFNSNNERRLVVPRRKLPRVIFTYHDDEDAAHPGVDETVRAIEAVYYAKNLRKQVSKYIKNCIVCHAVKTRQLQDQAPQRPHLSKAPFEVISVDILGPYPNSKRGNKFIIVIEDIFTKWVEARATKKADTERVKQFLEEEIFNRYGHPREIISDNGPCFTSQEYVDMCEQHQIKPLYTAVYFQRENPVERKIAELKKVMRTLQYREFPQDRWDEHLPKALGVLRSRKNRATGMTPSKALLGYELAKRGQWEIPTYERQRHARSDDARERRRIIRTRQLDFEGKEYPDQFKEPPVTFRRGDKVMVRDNNPSGPFAPVWSGPHEVAVRWSPQIYEVDKNGRQFKYHVDQLRPAPAGNPDEPEELESDDDEPRRVSPNDEASSSEDEGPPVQIVTRALIHTAPQSRETGGLADTEVEHRVPSPSGTSNPPERLSKEDGNKGRQTSSTDQPSDLIEMERPEEASQLEQRPTTSRGIQGPGPIILRRPRRRQPAQFSIQPQGYISAGHDSDSA